MYKYLFFFDSFYKGLTPLWGRQVPYTMMKFASFERTVGMYKSEYHLIILIRNLI